MVTGAPPLETADGLSLPLEQYLPKISELHVIDLASASLIKKCMARYGFGYSSPTRPPAVRDDGDPANMSRRYGISDAQTAAKWGYAQPTEYGRSAPTDQLASMSDAEYDVLWGHTKKSNDAAVATLPDGEAIPTGGCTREANRTLTSHGSMAGDDLAQRLDTQSFAESQSDPRVQQVISLWAGCMSGDGYSFKTPFDPMKKYALTAGASPGAAEIATALADISCKKKVGLLTTCDSVESAIQREMIATNAAALSDGVLKKSALLHYAASVIS